MSAFVPLADVRRSSPPKVSSTRVALISLGCAKNLVDAEQMLGALAACGYRLVADAEQAEVVIVNTCSFIASAREEAIREIRAAARLKRAGACRALVVAGCLAQTRPDEIRETCPEVDAVVGVSEFHHIAEVVAEALGGRPARPVRVSLPEVPYQEYLPRRRATPPWTAYLKVAEGCDMTCTFCTIPHIRGTFRSRAPEAVAAEVEGLVADGVREVVLIAEDLTHYGHDLTGGRELAGLLRRLGAVDGLDWIRLLYCYPTKIDEELIEAIAGVPAVLPYVDMPLQHADDGILRAMQRGGSAASYLRLIQRLRQAMPEVCLRSTFIVGFPGEHREQFQALERFLDEAQLDRVGFFTYSPEPGTPAADLPGRVPSGVAESRVARLAARQEAISRARNEAWVGRHLTVLVERADAGGGVGRSFRDAPEIDGVVRLTGRVRAGELVAVQVTAASTHDLTGRVTHGEEGP